MKWAILLIHTLLITSLSAQYINDPQYDLIETKPCLADSSVLIEAYTYWDIFQTTNNEYDGPIDSTVCIGIEYVNGVPRIPIKQANPNNAIFIRSTIYEDSLKVLLNKDDIYSFFQVTNTDARLLLTPTDECKDSICSGVILVTEVPNEDKTGFNLRKTYYPYIEHPTCIVETCLITERFEYNRLKEFVIKLSFDEENLEDKNLFAAFVEFNDSDLFDKHYIDSLEFTENEYVAGQYIKNLNEFSFYTSIIFRNTGEQYPSATDPHYIDARLVPNSPIPQDLVIDISYSNILIQPFTILRGGLIEGSDSIRHNLIIQQNEFVYCLDALAEIVIESGTTWLYKSGSIEFTGMSSCMAVKNHGTLEIHQNSKLSLGNDGVGIVMLGDDATVHLQEKAQLEIDCLLLLNDTNDDNPQNVKIHLTAGTALNFGKNARIKNHYSKNKKLELHMNGGSVDLSNLDAASRDLVELIYPNDDKDPYSKEPLDIFPNPLEDILNVYLNQKELQYKIYSIDGTILEQGITSPTTPASISVHSLPAGVYLLTVIDEGFLRQAKFIKI